MKTKALNYMHGVSCQAMCILSSVPQIRNYPVLCATLKGIPQSILKAIDENIQESRRDWLLWMFERAGKHNANNEHYQFWQQNNHPIQLSTHKMLIQRLDYLHNNPVEAGSVDYPPEYLYSSARDYYTGQKGLLPVILVS